MIRKKFKIWLADPLFNATRVIVGIYVTNLGYLKDKPLYFTELLDGNIEELNKMLIELDTAIVIPETNNQDLTNLIDLEAKWANKKKKKVERCR